MKKEHPNLKRICWRHYQGLIIGVTQMLTLHMTSSPDQFVLSPEGLSHLPVPPFQCHCRCSSPRLPASCQAGPLPLPFQPTVCTVAMAITLQTFLLPKAPKPLVQTELTDTVWYGTYKPRVLQWKKLQQAGVPKAETNGYASWCP